MVVPDGVHGPNGELHEAQLAVLYCTYHSQSYTRLQHGLLTACPSLQWLHASATDSLA